MLFFERLRSGGNLFIFIAGVLLAVFLILLIALVYLGQTQLKEVARQRAMSLTGKSVSAQAFALRAKILEVDGFAGDPRLREVHPELSFAAMAGAVVAEAKTSWNGLMRRRQLLAQQGLAVPDRVEDAPTAAPDDILDAVAAAWTAMRVDAGRAERIGEPGPEPAIWR